MSAIIVAVLINCAMASFVYATEQQERVSVYKKVKIESSRLVPINSSQKIELDCELKGISALKCIYYALEQVFGSSERGGIIPLVVEYLIMQQWKMGRYIDLKPLHEAVWLDGADCIASIDCNGTIQVSSALSRGTSLLEKAATATHYPNAYYPLPDFFALFHTRSGLLISLDSRGLFKKWPLSLKRDGELCDEIALSKESLGGIFHYAKQDNFLYAASWFPIGPAPFFEFRKPGKVAIWRVVAEDPHKEAEKLGSVAMNEMPSCICYAPDHETCAVAYGSHMSLMAMKTWKVLHMLDHAEKISAVAYATQKNHIVTASDKSICIWDRSYGSLLYKVPNFVFGNIKAIVYHKPWSLVVLGATLDDTSLAMLDVLQGKVVRKCFFKDKCYSHIVYAPDRCRLALYGFSGLQLLDDA